MNQPGLVPLRADRWTPFVQRLQFRGVNLTGATLHAQVRLAAETTGDSLIDLANTSLGGDGLALVSLDTSGPIPISMVEMRLGNVSAHVPGPSRPGLDIILAWDLHVTPSGGDRQRWLYGPFIVSAGVTR